MKSSYKASSTAKIIWWLNAYIHHISVLHFWTENLTSWYCMPVIEDNSENTRNKKLLRSSEIHCRNKSVLAQLFLLVPAPSDGLTIGLPLATGTSLAILNCQFSCDINHTRVVWHSNPVSFTWLTILREWNSTSMVLWQETFQQSKLGFTTYL